MSAWRSSRAWAPALVVLLCAAGLVIARVAPVASRAELERARSQPEVSEAGRALVGGLSVGDRIVGWDVLAIDGPRDGVLRVDLGRDGVRFALMVAAQGHLPHAAPVQTERHVIYYGHAHPPGTRLPDGTIRATTHSLARRVRANEGEIEVPGM